jgi:hypothetical protein
MGRLYRRAPLAGAALTALAAALAGWLWLERPREQRRPPPDTLPVLVAALEAHGLALHALSSDRDGIMRHGAYLSEKSLAWDEANVLVIDAAKVRAGRWRGVVFVTESGNELLENSYRDTGRVWGRWLAFGDPELLDRIEAALFGTD